MMGCRCTDLACALAGYERTGAQLVGYDGKMLFPSGMSDDVGLYYFVPKIVRALHCSLDQAINLFFYGFMGLAFVVGLAGLWTLTRSWWARGFSAAYLGLFVWYLCRDMTDNYLLFAVAAMAIVPWALYFFQRNKIDSVMIGFCAVVGVASGYINFIRSYASGAPLLFLILALIFIRSSWWRKVLAGAALAVGLMIPSAHMSSLLRERMSHVDSSVMNVEPKHIFWHTVYAGFGFMRNDWGIVWDDATVAAHVRAVDQTVVYPSREYEVVARLLVFNLAKKHPQFVLQTMFAKAGVLVYYLLIFANIGLLLAWFYRKRWQIDFMFFIALAFSSLFGFIALPARYYLVGFLTLSVLFCIVSVVSAFAMRAKR